MIDHRFLAGLHAHGGSMSYGNAVNLAMSLGIHPADVTAFINDQMHKGRIAGDASAYGVLRLTRAGRVFLLAAEENAQKIAADHAAAKAEKIDDRKFQTKLAAFTTLLGFLAGLLVEHFTGIIELLVESLG